MDYVIRKLRKKEITLLDDFLYEAIFIPDWYTKEVPRDIIYSNPQIYASIKDFGMHPDDNCYVAEVNHRVIGAVWVGIADQYGHMDEMLQLLKEKGYKRASLGVNKENYAVRMYQNVGFKVVGDGADETEYLMVCDLAKHNRTGEKNEINRII